MKYLLVTYRWRHLTRPQVVDFQCPVTDVITAADGREALGKVSQFDISLVLLDIVMPGLDGFEVLEQMRQYENIPVIMLSGIGGETTKIDTLTLGADDYITKPFSVEELLVRIKAKLKRAEPS